MNRSTLLMILFAVGFVVMLAVLVFTAAIMAGSTVGS